MTDYSPSNESIKRLSNLATDLQSKLEEMKRPLVIEFAGTPKAGKTTCVNAIAKFFRRNQIPLHLVTERASLCPIRNKHHVYFNAWTGATSLAQLLESLELRSNIIMLDRGIFDTLVWMDFLRTWHSLSPNELKIIEDFFLLEPWSSRIDIVVALSVDPQVAMKREFFNQITDLPGSIMNIETLQNYNKSLKYALQRFHDKYHLIDIDTTNKSAEEGVTLIADQVLSAAYQLIDEDVAVVSRDYIVQYEFEGSIIKRADQMVKFLDGLEKNIVWMKRTAAEQDLSLVQIIPVAVIRRNNEILVHNIRGEKHGRLNTRNSIWAGGHIRISDKINAERYFSKNIFHGCLSRELDEELKIRLWINDLASIPWMVVWDTSVPRSAQHLGLFYEYRLSEKTPREVLHLREFYESKSKSLFTHFRPIDSDLAKIPNLEPWSIYYLNAYHNMNIPLDTQQGLLF